ncbi:hypothetical protein DHBDCA_p2899 [Dehalobacter sp. DCA]|nr:hypothetical protein DHBDCA_p2899 [Dehalobacter sp. DCA]
MPLLTIHGTAELDPTWPPKSQTFVKVWPVNLLIIQAIILNHRFNPQKHDPHL